MTLEFIWVSLVVFFVPLIGILFIVWCAKTYADRVYAPLFEKYKREHEKYEKENNK